MLFHVYDAPKPDGYFLYEPTGLYRTLLDAERTLAETRIAAIEALANYQNARARLERLTAPAPTTNFGGTDR